MKRITDNESCKACIDSGWRHFCANSTLSPSDTQSQTRFQGYCCENYPLLDSPILCNPKYMTCSQEVNMTEIPSYRYALCPLQKEICGEERDIIVQDYMKQFESGYMHPNQSCLWRFVPQIRTPVVVQNNTKMYRVMKLRINTARDVKLKALLIKNTEEVPDNIGIFENKEGLLVKEEDLAMFTIINVTHQLYVMAVPQDYGGQVGFDYYIDYVLDPSRAFNTEPLSALTVSAQQESTTSTEEENPYFNNYTRKILSYFLISIFALVFFYGIAQMYKVFYSPESKILEEVEEEVRLKKEQDLTLKQNREREEKWLYLNKDKGAVDDPEVHVYGGWILDASTPVTETQIIMNREAAYREHFARLEKASKEVKKLNIDINDIETNTTPDITLKSPNLLKRIESEQADLIVKKVNTSANVSIQIEDNVKQRPKSAVSQITEATNSVQAANKKKKKRKRKQDQAFQMPNITRKAGKQSDGDEESRSDK